MAHPQDNSAFLAAADEVRDYEYTRGRTSRDAEVAALASDAAELSARLDALRSEFDAYKATHPDTTPAPDPQPEPTPAAKTIIGMSAPAGLWATRVNEVGGNVGARRIFAGNDASDPWDDQLDLVEAALAAGQLPVFSTKFGGNIDAILNGSRDADAKRLADKLVSYGKPIAVAFWHEPNPDITGPQFVQMHERMLPLFQRGKVKVGPILNGWLLDSQASKFAAFTSPGLLAKWDWFGIDTYEQGTPEAPGKTKPVDRMPKLLAFLDAQGAKQPVLVGEYNGYSAKSIADMGDWLLAHPDRVWTGLCWNADGGKGRVLTGDRLTAFKNTLARTT